jgi:hypothetical protein
LSTFGRDADEIAASKRRYERQLAEKAITLDHAVRFSIETLQDASISDREARELVLTALTLKEF